MTDDQHRPQQPAVVLSRALATRTAQPRTPGRPAATDNAPTPETATRPPAPSRAMNIADSLTSREWEQLTDVVARRLERRVTDQLSRQGRRFTPRVF